MVFRDLLDPFLVQKKNAASRSLYVDKLALINLKQKEVLYLYRSRGMCVLDLWVLLDRVRYHMALQLVKYSFKFSFFFFSNHWTNNNKAVCQLLMDRFADRSRLVWTQRSDGKVNILGWAYTWGHGGGRFLNPAWTTRNSIGISGMHATSHLYVRSLYFFLQN
jgi:hypothetical protein